MSTRERVAALAVAAVVATVAGCGDDDDLGTGDAAAASSDRGGYCEAAYAWNTPPDPADHEFDEEWFAEVLRPRFDRLESLAPDAIADDVAVIAAALDGGDEQEGRAADLALARFSADTCGWHRFTVTAVDHAFDGAPDAVPAGVVAFEVTNAGDEPHMVKIVRRNDGVTTPFAELVALPEERQDQLVESFEPEDFIAPGDVATTVADLRAGDYALVCELPSGDGDGAATHASQGMVHEFTVE